jgi:hypothetical protein
MLINMLLIRGRILGVCNIADIIQYAGPACAVGVHNCYKSP